jgi:hypothetical protein
MTASSTGVKRENLRFPDWQWPVIEALMEKDNPDKKKLNALVMAAESAIYDRQQALSTSGDSQAEKQAIEDAVAILRILKTEALNFPDWNS